MCDVEVIPWSTQRALRSFGRGQERMHTNAFFRKSMLRSVEVGVVQVSSTVRKTEVQSLETHCQRGLGLRPGPLGHRRHGAKTLL